jgi:hypothetical protein
VPPGIRVCMGVTVVIAGRVGATGRVGSPRRQVMTRAPAGSLGSWFEAGPCGPGIWGAIAPGRPGQQALRLVASPAPPRRQPGPLQLGLSLEVPALRHPRPVDDGPGPQAASAPGHGAGGAAPGRLGCARLALRGLLTELGTLPVAGPSKRRRSTVTSTVTCH